MLAVMPVAFRSAVARAVPSGADEVEDRVTASGVPPTSGALPEITANFTEPSGHRFFTTACAWPASLRRIFRPECPSAGRRIRPVKASSRWSTP
jgi:hypothetical protein